MKIKRILWANDGSKESANALKIAEYFARLYGSNIIGLFANYVFYPITPNYSYYAGYIEEAAEKYKKDIERNFKNIKKELMGRKVNFTSKVIRGKVAKSINELSREKKADIICIGNTGKGFLTRILLGSNTLKVLRKSLIPVLSVPGTVAGNEYNLNKILVPIDISEQELNSLNFAVDLALKTNSSITVVYVLSITNNIREYPPKVIEQILNGIEVSLDEIISKVKEDVKDKNLPQKQKSNKNSLKIRKTHLVGLQPALKITNYAKRNHFDLIVMNSHSKGNVERLFLGSVTEEVIRNSSCPVIAIRPNSNY
ncbi:MAG: universal stress protein [Thermodesulfobacteriota bacterium]